MGISIEQLCDGVESVLSAATGLNASQSFDQLGEGINDWPLLQVYPEAGEQDPGGQTDRTTFHAGVRQTNITVLVDLYAQQRTNIAEDMGRLVPMVDNIVTVLEQQDKSIFGLDVTHVSFKWSWRRVVFAYGDQKVGYIGARFTLVFRIF